MGAKTKPQETTPATDPVHDFADGCPDDSAEHWKALAYAMSAEMIRERDIWHRDRRSRDEWQRDFKAFARREAREEVLRLLEFYLRHEVSRELSDLAYRLSNLPSDRLKAQDVCFVRQAATDLSKRISDWHPEQIPELAELRRFRDVAAMAGGRLHEQFGPDLDYLGYCRCTGCELSRGLEDEPAPKGGKYQLLRKRILPSEQREENWSVMPDMAFDTPVRAVEAMRELYQKEPNFAHRYELTTAASEEVTP